MVFETTLSNISVYTTGLFLLLNVCLFPFRFSSVCNYWNISVPSCSILSSVANICSVFICSFVFYSQSERKWTLEVYLFINYIISSVFVEISRMCYYGFALEIRIRKESIPAPELDNSRDLVDPHFPRDTTDKNK